MLKVSGIHMPLSAEASCRGGADIAQGPLLETVARALAIPPAIVKHVRVLRRSVDARKKNDIHFVCSVAVGLASPEKEEQLRSQGVAVYTEYMPLAIPSVLSSATTRGDISNAPTRGDISSDPSGISPTPATVAAQPGVDMSTSLRPVVVGTGPAGLFAALYLARAGARPLVLERGGNVEQRAARVAHFMETGYLDTQSNIQFGEGGAGTFSDGKLTTNTKNEFTPHVLHWFAEAGAPQEILWEAQPHIGSDRLPAVVTTMREEIIARGGEVLFDTQLTDLRFENGKLCEVQLHETEEDGSLYHEDTRWLPCTQLVLACGHSARDTFELLQQHGVHLEQKPFSVGVRIEHPQALVNRAQWGPQAQNPALGAASYKLATHGCAGRSVYTFCMCPGGEVVCAASEEGGIATNGMSPFARDGEFANAAVLVNVDPEDFGGGTNPLAGVRFQQEIEARAYAASMAAGGTPYQVPVQTVSGFLGQNDTASIPHNSCARGTVACNLHQILPEFVCEALVQALPQFERKIRGFAGEDALLFAPETRSSSPVRIARNGACQAWLEGAAREQGCGIFPAGEGAGYAGGIMSAACDGLRVAHTLLSATLGMEPVSSSLHT